MFAALPAQITRAGRAELIVEELGRNVNGRAAVPTSLQAAQPSQHCQHHPIEFEIWHLMHDDKSHVAQFTPSTWVSGINIHLVICSSAQET